MKIPINPLIESGFLATGGEINKDKIKGGAITLPFAEMVWVRPTVTGTLLIA